MTCKSSSEQSFKLTGIALMIVKVLREMGDTETESIISSLSAGGHHTSPQHYQRGRSSEIPPCSERKHSLVQACRQQTTSVQSLLSLPVSLTVTGGLESDHRSWQASPLPGLGLDQSGRQSETSGHSEMCLVSPPTQWEARWTSCSLFWPSEVKSALLPVTVSLPVTNWELQVWPVWRCWTTGHCPRSSRRGTRSTSGVTTSWRGRTCTVSSGIGTM